MPIVPVRGLGEIGVISDLSPQDTPFTSFNDARNIRFAEGKLSRSSVFKTVDSAYTYAKQVQGILDGGAPQDEGYIVSVSTDGDMEQYFDGVVTSVTPVGTLGNSSVQIDSTKLGGVTYMNRQADVPVYRAKPVDGLFVALPGWAVGDRTRVLRSYKDFLIALNITKSGVEYPGMVKWSDAAQVGAPPSNWDVAEPSSLAGENILNELRGELVDGLPMRDSFILYGQHQSFRMDFVGQPFIFRWTKLFDDQGMIAKNCAVDVDGKHYVFGRSDIYVHDGVGKISISDSKVNTRIFSEMDFSLRGRCFTIHDRFNGEISFCYPSVASDAPWDIASVSGCNRAAVFNYRFNTWTFNDLPAVVGYTEASLSQTLSYEDIEEDYDEVGSPYLSFEDTRPRVTIVASDGLTGIKARQPFFYDRILSGRSSGIPDPDVFFEAFARASYKDLDELQLDLSSRKLVRRLLPQITTDDPDSTVLIRFGQSTTLGQEPVWNDWKVYQPDSDYKYDLRVNGRYLHLEFRIPSGNYAEFGAFDVDIVRISGR